MINYNNIRYIGKSVYVPHTKWFYKLIDFGALCEKHPYLLTMISAVMIPVLMIASLFAVLYMIMYPISVMMGWG